MNKKDGFWRYQFPAIVWAGIIFGISSLPISLIEMSPRFHLDKLLHVGIFYVFCLLLNRALLNQSRVPHLAANHLVVSLVLVVAYGILDELHQTVVPGRTPDVYDALADSLGGLACTFYLLLRANRAKAEAKSDRSAGSRSP